MNAPASPELEQLLNMTSRQLGRRLAEGHVVDVNRLANTEYRGISLGLPALIEKLSWKTFRKVFYKEEDGSLRGWNVRCEQTGLDGDYPPRLKKGQPFTWGYYRLYQSEQPCPWGSRSAMIDYGKSGNPPGLIPLLRDPLVALEKDSVDWLLGASYLQLGFLRIKTPSFFLLTRSNDLTYKASARGGVTEQ